MRLSRKAADSNGDWSCQVRPDKDITDRQTYVPVQMSVHVVTVPRTWDIAALLFPRQRTETRWHPHGRERAQPRGLASVAGCSAPRSHSHSQSAGFRKTFHVSMPLSPPPSRRDPVPGPAWPGAQRRQASFLNIHGMRRRPFSKSTVVSAVLHQRATRRRTRRACLRPGSFQGLQDFLAVRGKSYNIQKPHGSSRRSTGGAGSCNRSASALA
jgi:hypothetical protein